MKIISVGIDRQSLSLTNKANQLADRFLYEDALDLINTAIKIDSKNYVAYLSKVSILGRVGDVVGMNSLSEITLAQFPFARNEVAAIRSYVYASNGEFIAGADELRFLPFVFLERDIASKLTRKTVRVKRDRQFGYGTLILLSRCLVEMANDADHVYFEVPEGYDLNIKAKNVTLIKNSEFINSVDVEVTYSAMQEYFWRNAERMAKIRNYLFVSDEPKKGVSITLAPPLRIGLCWQGGGVGGNKNRFIDLELLDGLLRSKANFVSLKKRPSLKEFDLYDRFQVDHVAAWFDTWETTANLIKSLDLVISVDTAIAHLAGAVGVPVWLLLPHYAEWHFYGDPIAWYDGFTVYRQPTPGDWSTPIRRIEIDIQHKLNPSKP